MNQFRQLALDLRSRYPKFSLVAKEDSKLMSFIYRATLMKWWNPRFLTDYTTTMGYTVYMPRFLIGTYIGYDVLRHEAIHIKDYAKWNVLMGLSYVLFFPFILTMRAVWEYRGYVENMKVELEETDQIGDASIEWIIKEFTGPSYLWMFPFPKTLRRMLQKKREALIRGHKNQ